VRVSGGERTILLPIGRTSTPARRAASAIRKGCPAAGFQRFAGGFVRHQVEGNHQALAAHFTDHGVTLGQCLQLFEQLPADLGGVARQVLGFDVYPAPPGRPAQAVGCPL